MKTSLVIFLLSLNIGAFSQLQPLKAEGTSSALYLMHVITGRENFLTLALKYRLSPNIIATYNNLPLGSNLTTGQAIKIPLTPNNFDKTGYSANLNDTLQPLYVHFSKEESLINVIYNYDIHDTLIKKWNPQITNTIPGGTNLVIGFLKVKKEKKDSMESKKPETGTLIKKTSQ